MIFVEHCAGCGRRGPVLCRTCRFALVASGITTPSGVIAAVPFRGRARDVVLGLKYGNRRAVSRHLAGLLVNRLIETGAHRDVDVVTWAPTSTARRRRRGFDQAEFGDGARQLGLPVRALLRRTDETHQTGVGRAERQQQATFVAHPRTDGRSVLIVDDVVTTGATLRHAEHALRTAGAATVQCAAVAATPDGRSHGELVVGPWTSTVAAPVTTARRHGDRHHVA